MFTLGDGDFVFEALERFLAGIFIDVGDNVLREVKHAVEVAAGEIKQQPQVGRDAAGVPDVSNRSGKGDVTHALAADGGAGHFDAALVADDAFITGILVFSAVALPVTGGAEDGFAEEPILFRAQTTVVDGFRFENFAVRPAADSLRRRKGNSERGQSFGFHCHILLGGIIG